MDVIKVDTECRERQVLQGARETMRSHRPVIFLEVMDCEDWRSEVSLIDDLRRRSDYLSVRLRRDGALVSKTVGYDEPWRNQALWPAERISELREMCGRIRLPLVERQP